MKSPIVGIVVGSDSDLTVIKAAAQILTEFEIAYEVTVCSAHRTPDRAAEYVNSAEERGLEVIIAAAGVAAHLPGVIAAGTVVPVIGIPIASGPFTGKDALYSIVQMPPGIPVATMAINGAKNAALFAVQILGAKNPEFRTKLKQYRGKMAREVDAKNDKLQELGINGYLSQ